jgi:RNA polymerase sigma-70 factor (ECF subfamily)
MNYPVTWQNDILISCSESEDIENIGCSEKTDKQLVELILAGDETAFEQVFDRYKRLVASIAGCYFQRPEQIEEIIQISFAKVYSELKTFQGKHEFSLAGWLGRITRNVCLDSLRNQKRKPENLFCEFSAERIEALFAVKGNNEKTAELLLAERDLAEKLLSHLQPEDRVILQMIYEEEMSISQVAEATGSSIIKIKVRAHRARYALRKILKKFL